MAVRLSFHHEGVLTVSFSLRDSPPHWLHQALLRAAKAYGSRLFFNCVSNSPSAPVSCLNTCRGPYYRCCTWNKLTDGCLTGFVCNQHLASPRRLLGWKSSFSICTSFISTLLTRRGEITAEGFCRQKTQFSHRNVSSHFKPCFTCVNETTVIQTQ